MTTDDWYAEIGVDYCFTPFVAVTKNLDGTFTITVDWSDSFQYTHDRYSPTATIHEYKEEASAALDHWLQEQMQDDKSYWTSTVNAPPRPSEL